MTELELWVIYKDPLDVPGKFVLRKWIYDKPTKTMHIKDTLEEIRAIVPPGLFNIGRSPGDDPKILEVWI